MVKEVSEIVPEGRGHRQKRVTRNLVENYILNSSPTVSDRVCVRGKPGKHGAALVSNRILRGN